MVDLQVARGPARWACAVVGGALVFLFGTPIVHAWARGAVPYDLHGLTWSTLPQRLPETVAIMECCLGIIAVVAACLPTHRSPLVAAALLTLLIAWSAVQIEPVSPALLAVRVVVVIGGSIALTALIAAATPRGA